MSIRTFGLTYHDYLQRFLQLPDTLDPNRTVVTHSQSGGDTV